MPAGPLGAGTARKCAGSASASLSRAWWSHAIQTSPVLSGSRMETYVVDQGLVTAHRRRMVCHIWTASGDRKPVSVVPVNDG